MNMSSGKTAGFTTSLRQDEALKLLDRLERPSIPIFYSCGIIDADVGYYQLATLENGKRILVYALNLEDLQLKAYPYYGNLFAHSEKLYGVNVYDKDVSCSDIYNDLTEHQAKLRRVMREEYTLVRTGKNVFQSRAVSYALNTSPAHNLVPTAGTSLQPKVHVDAFIDALHDANYAKVYNAGTASLYERMRHQHIRLSSAGPVAPFQATYNILEHFTGMLNRLSAGEDGIQLEDERLTIRGRLSLRFKIYAARFGDNIRHSLQETWDELREKKVSTSMELFKRVWAFVKIPVVIHESVVELGLSLWEAFNVSHVGHVHPHVPEELAPYIEPARMHSRLNLYLHRLNPVMVESAKPMTMDQSNLCLSEIKVLDVNPFLVSRSHLPSPGSIRSPLGTMLLVYPNTSLVLQANGVWMALRHDTNKTYVGYNKDLDTHSKPTPPPVLSAWLGEEKLVCYTHKNHEFEVSPVSLDSIKEALHEITDAGDGHFLTTHKPDYAERPYIIEKADPPLLMKNGLWTKTAAAHCDEAVPVG